MNSKFKDWLIKNSEDWPPEEKERILRMIKKEPKKIKRDIGLDLPRLAAVFSIETDTIVLVEGSKAETREIFKAYKIHFATELANLK